MRSATAPVLGTVQVMQTTIHIRWAWLSLLAILVGLTIVFLLLVILDSRRHHTRIWKSSGIAALRAMASTQGPKGGLVFTSTMQHESRGMKMNFCERSDGSWVLQREEVEEEEKAETPEEELDQLRIQQSGDDEVGSSRDSQTEGHDDGRVQ